MKENRESTLVSRGGGDGRDYAVVLPCDTDEFGHFIASLLGRPQVLEASLTSAFEVGREDIESLYLLVEQYVRSHGNATLVSFNVKIMYDDESSVTLDSYEDFLSYNEIRPLISVGVVLSWIFLIKFNDKNIPEKNQIDIVFNTYGERIRMSGIRLPSALRRGFYMNGMSYSVRHTNRAWAEAIQSLIVGQLEGLKKDIKFPLNYLSKYSDGVATAVAVSIFILLAYGGSSAIGEIIERQSIPLHAAGKIAAENLESISAKIKALSDFASSGIVAKYAFYGSAYIFVAGFIAIYLGTKFDDHGNFYRPSFVALSKKAKSLRDDYPNKEKRHWIFLLGAISTALLISTASRFVFSFLIKYFNITL